MNSLSADKNAQADVGRESDLLRSVAGTLRDRLPSSWEVDLQLAPPVGGWRPDALLRIKAPDGSSAALLVEAKLDLEPRAIEPLVAALEQALVDANLPAESKGPPMVVARFVSPRAREVLEKLGACYADATGNARIALDRPALLIERRGADRNPWREVRALRSLRGRGAARVVRALCDFRPPFGVRELAERSGASAGSAVRTLDLLEREALIVRNRRKQVTDVDLSPLIRRWADDFRFTKQNSIRRCFEPRRLERTIERLIGFEGRYAVTGSFAAAQVAQYAESRLLVVYVDDPDAAQGQLGVRSAGMRSNVWLVAPPDGLPFERAWERGGLCYAALAQVACDLLGMPGRAPAEAEELLRWMEANPDAWRAD